MQPGRSVGSSLVPSILVLALALSVTTSCTSKKQEARERLKKAIQRCRAADGPMHEAPLRQGSETAKVLVAACTKEMGEVELSDGGTAQVTTGPYTWSAALERGSGAWKVTGVSFPPVDKAMSLFDDDSGPNELEHAAERLKEAQETFPESGWIRLERLEVLIELRKTDRENSESALKLGDAVDAQFSDTVDWSKENDRKDVLAQARIQIIDYYESFIDHLQGALDAQGSKDEWRKNAIEQAEEEGNDERAEKLRKQLERMKEKRKKTKRKYPKLIDKAKQRSCAHIDQLQMSGITDEEVRKKIKSKKATDCSDSTGIGP